jgi:phage shock protein PspC (stress-responsive transcriptional regulator)
MNPTPDCTHAQAALQSLLSDGREPSASDLEHLSTCPDCRAMAQRIQNLLSAMPEPTPSEEGQPHMNVHDALHDELTRQSNRHLGFQLFGLTMLVGGFTAFWAWALKDPMTGWSWSVALLLIALFTVPVMLLLALSRLPRAHRVYKRLREGRMLSGVCMGLAERTSTPVWAWRVGFVALAFIVPNSMFLYAVLASIMPVHPEDRAGLLRFRIARWFRRLRGGSTKAA